MTFYFEGNIDFIHDFLNLDESVYVGAPFSGSYTFDPTGIIDDYPDDPRVGSYYFGAAAEMRAQIGNYEFVTRDLGIFVTNDLPDVYEPINSLPFEAAGIQWSIMSIMLIDETRTALNNDALVTTIPDLDAFSDFHGLLLDLPGDDLGIRGVLTSLTPEPGTLAILTLGTALLMPKRRYWTS